MKGFNKKYLQIFAVICALGLMTVATMQCSKIEHLQEDVSRPESKIEEGSFVLDSRGESITPPIYLNFIYTFPHLEEDLTHLTTTESVLDYHSRKNSYAIELLKSFESIEGLLNESKSVIYLSPQSIEICLGDTETELQTYLLENEITDFSDGESEVVSSKCINLLKSVIRDGGNVGLYYSNEIYADAFPENWRRVSIDVSTDESALLSGSFNSAVVLYQRLLEMLTGVLGPDSNQFLYLNFSKDLYPNLYFDADEAQYTFWNKHLSENNFKVIKTNATEKFEEMFGHQVLNSYRPSFSGNILSKDKNTPFYFGSIFKFDEDLSKLKTKISFTHLNWILETQKNSKMIFNQGIEIDLSLLSENSYRDTLIGFYEWMANNFLNKKNKTNYLIATISSIDETYEAIKFYDDNNPRSLFSYDSTNKIESLYPYDLSLQQMMAEASFESYLTQGNDIIGAVFSGGNFVSIPTNRFGVIFDPGNVELSAVLDDITTLDSPNLSVRYQSGEVEGLNDYNFGDENYIIIFEN